MPAHVLVQVVLQLQERQLRQGDFFYNLANLSVISGQLERTQKKLELALPVCYPPLDD